MVPTRTRTIQLLAFRARHVEPADGGGGRVEPNVFPLPALSEPQPGCCQWKTTQHKTASCDRRPNASFERASGSVCLRQPRLDAAPSPRCLRQHPTSGIVLSDSPVAPIIPGATQGHAASS